MPPFLNDGSITQKEALRLLGKWEGLASGKYS